MPFRDTLISAIAGPGTVRRSQERGVERAYSAKRDSTEASNELPVHAASRSLSDDPHKWPLPAQPSRDKDRTSLSTSASPRRAMGPPPRRPCVQLQRSYSEQPATSQSSVNRGASSTKFSPEQMSRTLSNDSILSMPIYPVSPFPEMRGFGRYRTAVDADSEWHAAKLRRQLSEVDGLIPHDNIAALTGLTPEQLRDMNEQHRRGSMASSKSARSISSGVASDLYIDARTGTRVSRGFSPCTSLSTHGSFGGRSNSSRGDFGTFMRISSRDDEHGPPTSLYRNQSSSGMTPNRSKLASMVNDQEIWRDGLPKKVGRPCEFPTEGDIDNAVASDAEDEDDPETWEDIPAGINSTGSMLTLQIAKRGVKSADDGKHLTYRSANTNETKNSKTSSETVRTRTIRAGDNRRRRTISKGRGSNTNTNTARPSDSELLVGQHVVTANHENKDKQSKKRAKDTPRPSEPVAEHAPLTIDDKASVVSSRQRSATILNVGANV